MFSFNVFPKLQITENDYKSIARFHTFTLPFLSALMTSVDVVDGLVGVILDLCIGLVEAEITVSKKMKNAKMHSVYW